MLRTDCSRLQAAALVATRSPRLARKLIIVLGELEIEFALGAVGGELGDQLAFGRERLEPFQPVLKFCHRRVPIKRLKDDQPKPGK